MCKNGKIISVKIKGEELRRKITTNCGHCVQCRTQKALDWTFRCFTESLRADNAYFLTLTMDDANMVDSPDKRDIQLFHKKLRNYFKDKYGYTRSLKYFLVSEYGEKTDRIHYHAIYFNLPYGKTVPYTQISNEISAVWGKGIVYTKAFIFNQIAYCLKYLHKDKEYGNIQLSSKNLGEIDEKVIRYMNTTPYMDKMKVRSADGWMVNIPRYFRKKYMTDEQKEAFTAHFVRKAEMEATDVMMQKTKRLNFERKNNRFKNNRK